MPTQSGIHQFRGKYGTTCYYFTKGKQNGLQRGINQQMSERVKRDPAFANTRLYAREFGYSARLAALSFVPTEFGLTINLRANSQGRLTKIYRNLLNEYGIGSFGHRNFHGLLWQPQFVAQINDMCRIDVDTMYPITHKVMLESTGRSNRFNVHWTISWNSTLIDRMTENGLQSLWLRLRHFTLNAGHYNADAGAYVDIAREVGGYSADYQLPIDYARTHSEYTVILHNANIYYPEDFENTAIGGNSILSRPMVAVEGYRNVGGIPYKQQSMCGYKVLENVTYAHYDIDAIQYNGQTYTPESNAPTITQNVVSALIIADYLSNFSGTSGFEVKINNKDVRANLLTSEGLIVQGDGFYSGETMENVSITYPDGKHGVIAFILP